MAKKHTTTHDKFTNYTKLTTTKHRGYIEQQLKSTIISHISPIFPDDLASLMIKGATAEMQTLSDSELINFTNNCDAFFEWYDARHINS